MVVAQNTMLQAHQPQQDRCDGPLHVSVVVNELFKRFPLPAPEIEPLEIVEPVAA